MYKKTQQTGGFTIVELIVVIGVIAILVAVTVVSYSSYQQRASKAAADSTMQQVKTKLGVYFRNNDYYPANKGQVTSYLNSINESSMKNAFNTIMSGGGTYDTSPASCNNNPANKCTGYTITIPASYWNGSGSPIVVEP